MDGEHSGPLEAFYGLGEGGGKGGGRGQGEGGGKVSGGEKRVFSYLRGGATPPQTEFLCGFALDKGWFYDQQCWF